VKNIKESVRDILKNYKREPTHKQIHNKWITYIEDRPFNDQRYYISNQKLKDLGWDITVSFDEGLKMLI